MLTPGSQPAAERPQLPYLTGLSFPYNPQSRQTQLLRPNATPFSLRGLEEHDLGAGAVPC